MKMDFQAEVLVVGLGAAGGCAAIEAHDYGAKVIVIERQPEHSHMSNTRMSGGGFHSPNKNGNFDSLKAYSKAMFSGEGILKGFNKEKTSEADEFAELWAKLSPENEDFMCGLDPMFQTLKIGNVAFEDFPGAAQSGYAVVKSTYTGTQNEADQFSPTNKLDKLQKESGEAFHACLMTGIQNRNITVHYGTRALSLITHGQEIIGLRAEVNGKEVNYFASRGVILTCGGYEYNENMRKAFLDGPAVEGWAFYGSPENTGDGIRMALKVGASLLHIGSVAGRIICAVPERRYGLKVGLNTSSVGKPNEVVVNNSGSRYASERLITKDPSRYIFYKQALHFDMDKLTYPRIPSWMIFDSTLMNAGPLVRINSSTYNGIDWGNDNQTALKNGWILSGDTLEELARQIRLHEDAREEMDTDKLIATIEKWNNSCSEKYDPEFNRDPNTMGSINKPPYFAIPLYPGGPNTKGGLRTNPQRRVLDWDGEPIPRLYSAGEISSVFQFVYQGGGNLAEGIAFGRLAGRNAASELPCNNYSPD